MTNIVTIGGGTGSYTVLSGLKDLPNVSLSALVSMSDNGGSTGALRDELGVLPPGDVRQCLVALSEHTDIVRKLINYRFTEGTLTGHSFGNIFLAALEKVTGDFVSGVEVASEILKVNGRVIPITKDKADLAILLPDDNLLEGQVNITNANLQELGFKKIFYKNDVKLNKNAKLAIEQADYIIVGPGDYYCSVLPNLIVDGFKEAILQSKAKIILPVNLTNKNGHTLYWKVSDYLKSIESYLDRKIDIILVNNEAPSDEQIERYKLQEGDGVLIQDDLANDTRVIKKKLISHVIPISTNSLDVVKRSFIRHDSTKLSECINDIIKPPKVKLIFDFDDVLFDNTKRLKKRMYSILEANGVSCEVAEKYYKEVRENGFSMKNFVSNLLVSQNMDKVKAEEIHDEIMSECENFINTGLIEIVEKMGKENCFIVSKGLEAYQMEKIKKSKIDHLFREINIVLESKREAIERICLENKDSRLIFIDDKIEHFNNLDMEKCNNLTTILFDENGMEKLIREINKDQTLI